MLINRWSLDFVEEGREGGGYSDYCCFSGLFYSTHDGKQHGCVCLFVCLLVCLFVCLFVLFVCLFVSLFVLRCSLCVCLYVSE